MDSPFSRLRHGVLRFAKAPTALHRIALRLLAFCCVSVLVVACISYRFTGTNINYDLIKTIQIDRFPNRAPYGWAPMEAMFNNKLQDIYANQTRLTIVKRAGDMHLSGEIVGYDQFNKGIAADGFIAGATSTHRQRAIRKQEEQPAVGTTVLSFRPLRLASTTGTGAGTHRH